MTDFAAKIINLNAYKMARIARRERESNFPVSPIAMAQFFAVPFPALCFWPALIWIPLINYGPPAAQTKS